jgi:hypothetical protein
MYLDICACVESMLCVLWWLAEAVHIQSHTHKRIILKTCPNETLIVSVGSWGHKKEILVLKSNFCWECVVLWLCKLTSSLVDKRSSCCACIHSLVITEAHQQPANDVTQPHHFERHICAMSLMTIVCFENYAACCIGARHALSVQINVRHYTAFIRPVFGLPR